MILTDETLLDLAKDPRLQWSDALGPLRRAYLVRISGNCSGCRKPAVYATQIPKQVFDALRLELMTSSEVQRLKAALVVDTFAIPLPNGAITQV